MSDKCECPARKALELALDMIERGFAFVTAVDQCRTALAAPCPCDRLREQADSYRQTTEKLLDRAIPAPEGPLEFALCLMRETAVIRAENKLLRQQAIEYGVRVLDLVAALEGIFAITDRNHITWDKAHAAIAKARGEA